MSTVEFKAACKAHRECCPYKSTPIIKCKIEEDRDKEPLYEKHKGKCGANEILRPDGKCPIKDCYYMAKFKETLRKLSEK